MRVPVTDDLSRESVVSKHSLDKEFRYPLCCNFLGAGYEEGGLGAVVVSDSEDGVVFLGLRKFRDEVQSDDFKRICLWLREYRY